MVMKRTLISLTLMGAISFGYCTTAQAANPKAAKKIEEMRKKAAKGKQKNLSGLYHKWSIGIGGGYSWAKMDVDAAPNWLIEAQRRVSTYGVVAVGLRSGTHDLNNRAGNATLTDMNISYVQYVHEDTYNRQPNFYYGGGVNLLFSDVDRIGSNTSLGWHLRAGVEFKAGLFTELRYTMGPTKSKFNNARLGDLAVLGGYRFGL